MARTDIPETRRHWEQDRELRRKRQKTKTKSNMDPFKKPGISPGVHEG